jgi:hypothetical protein
MLTAPRQNLAEQVLQALKRFTPESNVPGGNETRLSYQDILCLVSIAYLHCASRTDGQLGLALLERSTPVTAIPLCLTAERFCGYSLRPRAYELVNPVPPGKGRVFASVQDFFSALPHPEQQTGDIPLYRQLLSLPEVYFNQQSMLSELLRQQWYHKLRLRMQAAREVLKRYRK